MNVRRHLWPDERIRYRSVIYRRATVRRMIGEHNSGSVTLSPRQLDTCMDGIASGTQLARSILTDARFRALGYTR